MEAVNIPGVTEITILTSSQIGKTEVLNNIIGYFIDQNPAPILVVQPTLEMAQAFSKDRLAPMIRDTEVLRGKVREPRSKDSSNTILHKSFPGGHITVAGSNSPASLASRPVRTVLSDEIDRWPSTVGAEGDPLALAEKRSITFWNRRLIRTSTPTVSGVSRIEALWDLSNKSYYYVPCHTCKGFSVWLFNIRPGFEGIPVSLFKFDKDNLAWVYFLCPHCNNPIEEKYKYQALVGGHWAASRGDRPEHYGFHINEFYSPWSNWKSIAAKFLESKDYPERLKVFVNTTLGQTWEEAESYSLDVTAIEGRVEHYETVPSPACLITAGVDVQENRLEVSVVAWGPGEEAWVIDYKALYGEPQRPDVWDILSGYITQSYEHEIGIKLKISAVFVDSGYLASQTYTFTKSRQGRNVYAAKGYGGMGRPLLGKPTKNNKARALVFPIGVDEAKTVIYDRLQISDPGPGYFHFKATVCSSDYFSQLTSEKHITKYVRGYPTKVWVLRENRRNEALDTMVYAYSAMKLLNPNWPSIGRGFERRATAIASAEARAQAKAEGRKGRLIVRPARTEGPW